MHELQAFCIYKYNAYVYKMGINTLAIKQAVSRKWPPW